MELFFCSHLYLADIISNIGRTLKTNENKFIGEISGLSVSYGNRFAVEDLNLSIREGAALALLGLNGAGKTSTIHAMLGLVRPRTGSILLFGEKHGSIHSYKRIGYVPEDVLLPDFLSAKEYLMFAGSFKIADRQALRTQVGEILEWFELSATKKIRESSKGMIRRMVLAQAFLGPPKLLILDEPLNGLDPILIMKLREYLDKYRKNGGTLFYSSHILGEVEKTCTEIVLIRSGKVVYQSSTENTIAEFGSVENAFAQRLGKS